ncbi:MAG: flagellar hook-length control protein FliK [Paraglaciecola sp.]|uniref:flagellar hook-length control protein FliK n=1 Tax=Paraglaciecola sp. TaxID=1920173 RepID=UPI003297D953
MPDITQSSQATISQALTQLSQLAPTSEAARQGIEVLVKHLAGNTLSLNKSTVLLNKTVLLNNPEIKGKLIEGQNHQVKISLEPIPNLEFFSQASSKQSCVVALTEQQLQSLLRLPAKQLLTNNPQIKTNISIKLPLLNATILSVIPSPGNSPEQLKSHTSSANLEPNSTVTSQQNLIKVTLNEQRPAVELSLPVKNANQFTIGEKVSLTISPRGNNWQLTIAQNQTGPANQAQNSASDNSAADKVQLRNHSVATPLQIASTKIANPLLQQIAPTNLPNTDTRTSVSLEPNSQSKVANSQQSILAPLLATPIIKASLQQLSQTNDVHLELPIKPVLQQLTKIHDPQNQILLNKLQSLPLDKISLQLRPRGEIELLLQNIQPVAKIPVTKEIAQALAPLKLPNQQALLKQIELITSSNKQQSSQSELLPTTQKSSTPVPAPLPTMAKSNVAVPSVDGNQYQDIKLNLKDAASNLLTAVQNTPFKESVITPNLMANKTQQLNLVQSLLRIVQAKAESPAIPLQAVEKALGDTAFFKAETEQPSKQLVEQIQQQIKQALPQGKEQDVSQIRQLLSTPALNLSALQMVNPTTGQGFMSGLVTLLQMSLSARLARTQTARAGHITETLNNVLSGATKNPSTTITPKAMTDFSQLEQKHQLMKEIGRLMSGHQANKLSNAEQMIQGQDTFYYNLPAALGGTIKDIELLIKREENHKENASENGSSNKTWQLTMKLAVGELGELLTKAKLRADTLEINFYASNEAVKIQVMNYLPLLRRKFDSLGIDVSKSHCQLGKIPDTLQQRPYHMFQAKA